MTSPRLSLEGVGDLATFMAEARLLQQQTGINPNACIEIVECAEVQHMDKPPYTITPLPAYLGHLAKFRYATPPSNRVHDEVLHFRKVTGTHPRNALLISAYAQAGVEAYSQENFTKAEAIVDTLDATLASSIDQIFSRLNYPHKSRVPIMIGTILLSPSQQIAHLQLEKSHFKKMWGSSSHKLSAAYA